MPLTVMTPWILFKSISGHSRLYDVKQSINQQKKAIKAQKKGKDAVETVGNKCFGLDQELQPCKNSQM